MRYLTVLAAGALSSVAATTSAADCQPVLSGGDVSVVINGVTIEPGGSATENFRLRVRNEAGTGGTEGGANGSPPCEAIIRLAKIGLAPDPNFPPYSIRAPGNNDLEILPDVAAGGSADSDVFIANAPPGPQGRAVPFRVALSTEWGLRAGTYKEQLRILLIDADGNVADTANLTITITIPAAVSIRFVGAVVGGSASAARIDLGTLSSTQETRSDPFGALILSTAPYLVSFSSTKQGNLSHRQLDELIPYRLFFDGNRVDLAGVNEFPYFSPTPRRGDRRPMSIVVPPIVASAGRYEDRITATVTAM